MIVPLLVIKSDCRFIQYASNQIRGCTLLLTQQTKVMWQQTNVISDKACLTPCTPSLIQYTGDRSMQLLRWILSLSVLLHFRLLSRRILYEPFWSRSAILALLLACVCTTLQWIRPFLFSEQQIVLMTLGLCLEEPPNFRKLRVHRVVTEGRWLRSNSSSKWFSCLLFLGMCVWEWKGRLMVRRRSGMEVHGIICCVGVYNSL